MASLNPQEGRPGVGWEIGSEEDPGSACALFMRQYIRTDKCGVLAPEWLPVTRPVESLAQDDRRLVGACSGSGSKRRPGRP
jgi:hypothetical protein